MKDFIYKNSNRSGIGDRLFDLILVTTYSIYIGCQNIYLHWIEDNDDMVGQHSLHSKIRASKTPFRSEDYLLKNLKNYIKLPENIKFVSKKELEQMSLDKNNIVFTKYMGLSHTLYSFMNHIGVSSEDKCKFERIYFENLKKIEFKNIPDRIVDTFKNNNIVTIHLRRGDKVANDGGSTNNIQVKQLSELDNLTIESINELISKNYKNFNFVSDEKEIRNHYIKLFKEKANCTYFDGDNISQTYYDIYSLVHSDKIILSQVFSVFSIFSSLVRNTELFYIIKHPKIEEFTVYKNIKKFSEQITINRKSFNKDLLIHKFSIEKYPFEKIVKKCYENYFKKDIELDNLHQLLDSKLINNNERNYFKGVSEFGKSDRNSIFNTLFYEYYDNNNEFKDLYIKFINEVIKPIFFPSEKFLVVQTTPNIRQHLPGTTTIGRLLSDPNDNIIGVHKDGDIGHSKEEYNFILPVTKMFDTNSIYFEPCENSGIEHENYLNVNQEINELGCYYFNKCYHYNKINTTNKTRVSFDFRIIPYSRYIESDKLSKTSKNKLVIGSYFTKV